MKANELKVTDLMVGDWVSVISAKPNTYRRPFYQIITVEKMMMIRNGRMVVEPIHLTPEILGKNGFEGVKEGRFPSLRNYYNDIIFQLEGIKEEGNCKILYIFKNIPILYVHELQHILRSCKIDKEIVV